MYRKIEDFLEDWTVSSEGTLKVIRAITNDKLNQAIVEGHNTLGWLAWHLVSVGAAIGHLAELQVPGPGRSQEMPKDIDEIMDAYTQLSEAFKKEVAKLTDADLLEEVNGFGGPVLRGKLLRSLINHQTHHRGQMTVLLRQAGLPVPGVMGPTREMQQQ